ncbi:hypothetical protein CDL60_18150 [Roseateles noduli]|nr:hypothetical protein CDL60_18150 [Roseateles noduli]
MNAEREQLKQKCKPLFDQLAQLLFEADPMGINFESNTDEYDPEVGTILPRLEGAHSADDVQTIVHEEFCRWFGPEEAGTREQYAAVSQQIWSAWCDFKV